MHNKCWRATPFLSHLRTRRLNATLGPIVLGVGKSSFCENQRPTRHPQQVDLHNVLGYPLGPDLIFVSFAQHDNLFAFSKASSPAVRSCNQEHSRCPKAREMEEYLDPDGIFSVWLDDWHPRFNFLYNMNADVRYSPPFLQLTPSQEFPSPTGQKSL